MVLHEKLIRLRKQKGMSQLELAEALNVSRQAISKWEVGTAVPSTENLCGLSNLYGVSLDYLVGDRDFDVTLEEHARKMSVMADSSTDINEKQPVDLLKNCYANAYKISFPPVCVVVVCIVLLVLVCVAVHFKDSSSDDIGTVKLEELDNRASIELGRMDEGRLGELEP